MDMKLGAIAILMSWTAGTAGSIAYLHSNFVTHREAGKDRQMIYDSLKEIKDSLADLTKQLKHPRN